MPAKKTTIKSAKLVVPKQTLSLRRAKSKFRFDPDRDDLTTRFNVETAYVFHPSVLLYSGEQANGVYGAPVVILKDYEVVQDHHGNNSVKLSSDKHTVGRIVEVSMSELARLDQVAAVIGDMHRFKAEVIGGQSGHKFQAWVYQSMEHVTHVEQATSAIMAGNDERRLVHQQ